MLIILVIKTDQLPYVGLLTHALSWASPEFSSYPISANLTFPVQNMTLSLFPVWLIESSLKLETSTVWSDKSLMLRTIIFFEICIDLSDELINNMYE